MTSSYLLRTQIGILEQSKGQKISQANYLILISSKKRTKYLADSDLASMGQNEANISFIIWRM